MKTQAVLNCQIQKWYPTFRKVTFKTKLHKLSQEFVDYLREDGIVLHKDYNLNSDSESSDSSFSDDKKPEENEEKKVSDREEDQEISDKRKFTDLEKAIVDAVEDYDYFFVKLNWSSPKDADGWVPELKYRTMRDLIYALKVSTFIQHDLNHWQDECVDKKDNQESPIEYYLALRKWYSLTFAMEFRCFVKENTLIGISQRHTDVYYKFLIEDKANIIQLISNFFNDKIKEKFFDDSFVLDVYIEKSQARVWVMDFNPWGSKTDSLLFEWDELKNMNTNAEIVYKVIEKAQEIQESGLSQYKVPIVNH